MAYQYKQIGDTGAWIMSLLAVAGGALWFARTPGYPAPHPQDEAEIMTAVVERSMAMGRDGTNMFLTHVPENVSQVIVGSFTNEFDTLANNIKATFPDSSIQTIIGNEYDPGYFYTPDSLWGWCKDWCYYYPDGPDVSYWWCDGSPPWVLSPFDSYGNPLAGYGQITVTCLSTRIMPIYAYITNSAAYTLTNTVGMYPSATQHYPDAIRAALAANGTTRWLLQTNATALAGGAWDGLWDSFPTNYLDTDATYWTNYVTCATGHYLSVTNYAVTNVVYTNFPPSTNWVWRTNILWRSQLYTNDTTVDVAAGKLFAFERDRGGLYWSTNAYNDMARALALMQWQQKNIDDQNIYSTWSGYMEWHPTNRPSYFPASIDQGTLSISIAPTSVGGFYAAEDLYYNLFAIGAPWYDYSGMISVNFLCGVRTPILTNNTAFAYSEICAGITNNGTAWHTNNGTGNAIYLTNFFKIATHGSLIHPVSGVVQPHMSTIVDIGELGDTNLLIKAMTAAGVDAIKAILASLTQTVSTNSGSYQYQMTINDNGRFHNADFDAINDNLPYCYGPGSTLATYRVQFGALTDYSKHAPAR